MKKNKLNLKKCKFVHILNSGNFVLHYEEVHAKSGKNVSWFEEIEKDDLPFSFSISKHGRSIEIMQNFKSIYISDRLLPLLNECRNLELWPDNSSSESSYRLSSLVFNLKNNASVSSDVYIIDGKKYGGLDFSIVY